MTACPVFVAMMPATCVLQTPLLVQLLLLPLWWGPWVNGFATGQCLSDIPDFWMSCGYVFQLQCASKTSYPVRGAIFWAPNPANTCSLPSTCNDVGDFLCCPEESWEPCLLYDWTAVGVVFLVILLLLMLLGGNRSVFWFLIYPFFFSRHSIYPMGFFSWQMNDFLLLFPQWGPLSPTTTKTITSPKNFASENFPFSSSFSHLQLKKCVFFWIKNSSNLEGGGCYKWLVVEVLQASGRVHWLGIFRVTGELVGCLWWSQTRNPLSFPPQKTIFGQEIPVGEGPTVKLETNVCFYPRFLLFLIFFKTQLLKKWWLEDVQFQGCKWSLESWIQVRLLSCFPTSIFLLVKPVFSKALCIYCPRIVMKVPTPKKKTGGFENCCATKVSVGWINLIQSHRNLLHRKGFSKKRRGSLWQPWNQFGMIHEFSEWLLPWTSFPPTQNWGERWRYLDLQKTIPPKTPFTNSANICLDVDGLWLLCR